METAANNESSSSSSPLSSDRSERGEKDEKEDGSQTLPDLDSKKCSPVVETLEIHPKNTKVDEFGESNSFEQQPRGSIRISDEVMQNSAEIQASSSSSDELSVASSPPTPTHTNTEDDHSPILPAPELELHETESDIIISLPSSRLRQEHHELTASITNDEGTSNKLRNESSANQPIKSSETASKNEHILHVNQTGSASKMNVTDPILPYEQRARPAQTWQSPRVLPRTSATCLASVVELEPGSAAWRINVADNAEPIVSIAPRGILLRRGQWYYTIVGSGILRIGWASSAFMTGSWQEARSEMLGSNRRSWAYALPPQPTLINVSTKDFETDQQSNEEESEGELTQWGFMNAGETRQWGPRVVQQDTVFGVAIDLDRGILRFAMNGEWARDGVLEKESGKIRSWEHAPPSLQIDKEAMARGLFPAVTLSNGGSVVFDLECRHTQDGGNFLPPPPEWLDTCRPLAHAWYAEENEYDISLAPRERQSELTGRYADFWHLLPCHKSVAASMLKENNILQLANLRLDDNGADELCDLLIALSQRVFDSDKSKSIKPKRRTRGKKSKTENSEIQLMLRHNSLVCMGQLPTVLSTLDILTCLDLSYNSISDIGAERLSKVIENATCLKSLDISHNKIGDAGILLLIESLQINSSIGTVDFKHNQFSGTALVGVEELFSKTKTLKRVELGNNRLGDMGVQAVARGLTEIHSLDTTTRIEVIAVDLSSSGATAQGWVYFAKSISYNSSIEEISLGGNKLDDAIVTLLATQGFSGNPSLKRMNLSRNCIGDSGCVGLASELLQREPVKSSLQELCLRRNSVGAIGSQALASALRTNKALLVLDLGWCDIGDAGVVSLASAFHFNDTLLELRLPHAGIGNVGASTLFIDLTFSDTSKLQILDLQFNNIGGDGLEPHVLAELVRSTKTLKTINMGNNRIGPNESFEVSRMLALDECVVEEVRLLGNPVSAESRARLVDAVRGRQARLLMPPGA